VFWLQQAPGFTVPVSGSGNVGAPVAGLTNQQALAQYGLAVAGSVAPCSATRVGIDGFACAPGSTPLPASAPPPSTSPVSGASGPSPDTSSPTGCSTPDPFVALGGGTCYQGTWYPPGMNLPVTAPTSLSAPAPSWSSSETPEGCTTPDPFVALGGGTCYQGTWYPPGMNLPAGGTSSSDPSTTSTTTTQPVYGGSCATPDPFVVLGGGTCYQGTWYPPGMPIPGTSATSSGTTTSGSTTTSGTTTSTGSIGASSGPPVATGSKMLLSPGDFAYLGYYDVVTDGWDTEHLQGLTHRYVNGDLRFLTLDLTGRLTEFSLTGHAFGDLVNQVTQTWSQPWGTPKTLHGSFFGLWWDEAGQRLWTTHATDYNANFEPVQIYTRTLNANGTISNLRGPIGLQGLHAKRVYGSCQPIPQWFQTQYNVPPYACGWGGYTSILTVGSSMGFTMYAVPDPAGYASGSDIPNSQFTVMADHAAGSTRNDWYAAGAPTTLDRGRRLTRPINYFDGGDNRPNGNCTGCTSDTPTNPPLSTAQWLSPAPDGFGRWVWGDSYYNTGLWIDSPTKTGFIAVASLGSGKTWYCTSICTEQREFELHIFDPADLGQVIQGQMAPFNLQPKLMAQLTLPGLGGGLRVSNPRRNIAGATFDPTTNRLYLISGGATQHAARIYVFQVSTQ